MNRIEGVPDPEESRNQENSEGNNSELVTKCLLLSCAAWASLGIQCRNVALISCEICHLVAYCTEACKANHSAEHNASCPPPCFSPSIGNDSAEIPDHPIFDTGVFWGNYAASDVLNLEENEGPEYDGPLRILLLGPFGLRHLIYSFVAMPETADPLLDVTISEYEMPHLLRTFLSLLLISKDGGDPFTIADVVSHVWYSTKWPEYVHSYIRENVGQVLLDIHSLVQSYYEDDENRRTNCYGIQLGTPGYLTLDVVLDWYTWHDLLSYYFHEPVLDEGTSMTRIVDVSSYGEPLDRVFARMSPARAATVIKWRQNGILSPHGDSSASFTVPNPVFFIPETGQPTGITNEPLSEWPMNEVLDYTPYPAEDDVYGKMSFYVRDLVAAFQNRLKKGGMFIKIMACGLVEMVGHIPKYQHKTPYFDRIEVGHLFDLEPQLCFLSCSLLLRHMDENPFATMLTMSRESVVQSQSSNVEALVAAEKHNLYHPAFEPLDTMTPPTQAAGENYSAASLPRHMGLLLFRNWGLFSDRYLKSAERFGFQVPGEEKSQQPKVSILKIGYMGLHLKRTNTVTNRWPNRLVNGKDRNPTKEEVMRWMSWSTTKPQRWLEWKRVGDVSLREWFKYLEMIRGEPVVLIWKSIYGCMGLEEEDEEDEEDEEQEENGDEAAGSEEKNAQAMSKHEDEDDEGTDDAGVTPGDIRDDEAENKVDEGNGVEPDDGPDDERTASGKEIEGENDTWMESAESRAASHQSVKVRNRKRKKKNYKK